MTGRYVFIHAVFDKAWAALCEAMDRPNLIGDPRTATLAARGEHKPLVDEAVAAYAAAHSVEEIVECAERGGFVASPILNFGEVGREPHFRERGSVAQVDHLLHGVLTLQGVSPKFSRTPAGVRSPAPTLGQHNAEVYGGLLGLDEATLQTLADAGII